MIFSKTYATLERRKNKEKKNGLKHQDEHFSDQNNEQGPVMSWQVTEERNLL